ncbi:MAG TPA: SH3 domain-containing protein [Pyrinomonadaceae bacterium]|nr:SH3 domain-containing protein [Pyrinomonadaceae bacterium]
MRPQAKPLLLAYVCLLAALLSPAAAAQEVSLGGARQKIAVASNVRVRSGPETAAQEVARLKFGTVVGASARTAEQVEIGGKRDHWYKVALPTGETGWAFGGFLADYDAARGGEMERRIAAERLKAETMTFNEGVDLYDFLTTKVAEAKEGEARGELELQKLLALGRAAGAVQPDERERPPYREFLKAHERELYFHELAGATAVRSEVFWALERKYRGTAIGERIAWEAAENLTPGECESDEVCQFFRLHETHGRYLELYPAGPRAAEVLKFYEEALASEQVRETLRGRGGDKYVVEARTMLRKALPEVRARLAKTTAPEKAAVLKRLDSLAPAGR